MAEAWQEFVREAVEKPLARYEALVLRTDPAERRASLDVYLNILQAVSINISNPEPAKAYGAGPLAHLAEFIDLYVERVEKLRNDKELAGMSSSAMEAYFLLSKHLSVYKGSGLPFEFLENPPKIDKNEKIIQDMLKRYPELNSVIIGHAQPSRRSAPVSENVADSRAAQARRSSKALEKLVPSRADRAAEEGSRRRPSQPKRAA